MSNLIKVTLNKLCDWNENQEGWDFQYAKIPSINIQSITIKGEKLDPSKYYLNKEAGIIKWNINEIPEEAIVALELSAPKSPKSKPIWKEILIPVLPAIVAGFGTYYTTIQTTTDKALNEKISDLKGDKKVLNKEIDELEGNVDQANKQILSLQDSVSALRQSRVELTNELNTLKEEYATVSNNQTTSDGNKDIAISNLTTRAEQAEKELQRMRENSQYEVHLTCDEAKKNQVQQKLINALKGRGFVAHKDLWTKLGTSSKLTYYSDDPSGPALEVLDILKNQIGLQDFNSIEPQPVDRQSQRNKINVYIN